MINFYEELNLNKDFSIEDIKMELSKLENTWHRREITNPEKASKMISLIYEARTVFETNDSKASYDAKLLNGAQEKSNESSKYISIKTEIVKYCDNEQWDMAKIFVDKILGELDAANLTDDERFDIYKKTTRVYFKNNLFEEALNFANQAISVFSENLVAYSNKDAVLESYIKSIKDDGMDASKHERLHQTNCKVWIEKAKAQEDKKSLSLALFSFAKTCVKYEPTDYNLAEQYVIESLNFDPSNEKANSLLKWLNQPREITLDGLRIYENEKSPYEQEIQSLLQQIISNKLNPENELGWNLAKKRHLGHYSPNKDGLDEEETITFSYYLNKDSKFVVNKIKESEYWQKGSMPWKHNNESLEECSIDEVMKETDLSCSTYRKPKDGWEEQGDYVGYLSWQFPDPYKSVKLIRKSNKKGQALYEKLKSILDNASKYIEECNRINTLYNAEYEPARQSVKEKYAAQKEQFTQEKNIAIENAKLNADKRISVQNQISELKNELATLGFFSVKRKKELQTNIAQLEQSLSGIPTVDATEKSFDIKFKELECQETFELTHIEEELRKKYPLPKQ